MGFGERDLSIFNEEFLKYKIPNILLILGLDLWFSERVLERVCRALVGYLRFD